MRSGLTHVLPHDLVFFIGHDKLILTHVLPHDLVFFIGHDKLILMLAPPPPFTMYILRFVGRRIQGFCWALLGWHSCLEPFFDRGEDLGLTRIHGPSYAAVQS